MLSTVLNSERAVHVNINIMRAFVRLRQLIVSNESLGRKIATMERKYDSQFKVVFDAIRELMKPASKTARTIGFKSDDDQPRGRWFRQPSPPSLREQIKDTARDTGAWRTPQHENSNGNLYPTHGSQASARSRRSCRKIPQPEQRFAGDIPISPRILSLHNTRGT